jgi:hypothetical protein
VFFSLLNVFYYVVLTSLQLELSVTFDDIQSMDDWNQHKEINCFNGKQWLDTKGQGEFFASLSRLASEQAGCLLHFE